MMSQVINTFKLQYSKWAYDRLFSQESKRHTSLHLFSSQVPRIPFSKKRNASSTDYGSRWLPLLHVVRCIVLR